MEGTYVPKEKRKEEIIESSTMDVEEEEDEPNSPSKNQEGESDKQSQKKQEVFLPQNNPPNKMLFVQNIPDGISELVLQTLFDKFPGFKEVRLVQGKNVAFVEYQTDVQSSVAMSELQSFKIDEGHKLVVSFQKQ